MTESNERRKLKKTFELNYDIFGLEIERPRKTSRLKIKIHKELPKLEIEIHE